MDIYREAFIRNIGHEPSIEELTAYALMSISNENSEVKNFNPSQPRDSRGRWASTGSGGNIGSSKENKKLTNVLSTIAEFASSNSGKKNLAYSSTEDMVLKEGRNFNPAPKPDNIKQGEPKQCYKNASDLALKDSNLTYVEGYALMSSDIDLPIAHAWVVDSEGNVIDNTWKDEGRSYLGIPLKTKFLTEQLIESGVYGLISGSENNRWIEKGLPKDAIADITEENGGNIKVSNGLNGLFGATENFNPNQPRDDKGRWTAVGNSYRDPKNMTPSEAAAYISSSAPIVVLPEDEKVLLDKAFEDEEFGSRKSLNENMVRLTSSGTHSINDVDSINDFISNTEEAIKLKFNQDASIYDLASQIQYHFRRTDKNWYETADRIYTDIAEKWIVSTDSSAKADIKYYMKNNPLMRELTIFDLYTSYKGNWSEVQSDGSKKVRDPESYREWKQGEITIYRGGQVYHTDTFLSYTPSKRIAQGFVDRGGGALFETQAVPDDIIGYYASGETEIFYNEDL